MGARGGIDLGGTKIQAIVREDGSDAIAASARAPTPAGGGPTAIIDALVGCLQEAAAVAGVATEDLDGVGLGSPGEVDAPAGTIARAGNLSEWERPVAVADTLSERFGCRVAIGNDVDVATRAEFELGAGRGASSLLGVFWGTGVGGGLILDGRPWTGQGGAGELGHVVVRQGGARCSCGRRGCMEAYAGRGPMEAKAKRRAAKGRKTLLFDVMRERERERLSSSVWDQALRRGDGLAQELIDRALRALGSGVASAVNLLDVERVVLGGGLGTRFGQPMADRLAEAMRPHLFHDDRPPVIVTAALGDLGGAIGATLLVDDARTGRRSSRRPGSPTAST